MKLIKNFKKFVYSFLMLLCVASCTNGLQPGNDFNVYYDGNGHTEGNVPYDYNSYKSGDKAIVWGNIYDLFRRGYSFTGWNTKADGYGTSYLIDSELEITDSDITLYAEWSAFPTYNIDYLGDENTTMLPVDNNNYLEDDTAIISKYVPTNTNNLTFIGWNTESDGSGKFYTAGIDIEIETADITLYCQWSDEPGFVTIWDTSIGHLGDYQYISLPFISNGEYDCQINWGDGTALTIDGDSITNPSFTDFSARHYYENHGIYEIIITGKIEGWKTSDYWAEGGGFGISYQEKLIEIKNWGDLSFGDTTSQFVGCSNMIITATDKPDLSKTNSLKGTFACCYKLTSVPGLETWDISNITDMSGMFSYCLVFSQDLNLWNTSNIIDMSYMFRRATSFNGNISNWNTINVTRMDGMFCGAQTFNQDIRLWNISNVTSMDEMFANALSFNTPLNNWDTSNVSSMYRLFASDFDENYSNSRNTMAFNQPLFNWDTSKVTNMSELFAGCRNFDQYIDSWNTGNVVNMSCMFIHAEKYNNDLSHWDTSQVTTMSRMFAGASSFDFNISGWSTSNVLNMNELFLKAESFNQSLNSWDTSQVIWMRGMFEGAISFNGDISNWNTSNVENMQLMFSDAVIFNQDIGNWNTSHVTNMGGMFNNAQNFDQALSSWNITNVTEFDFTPWNDGFMENTNLSPSNYNAILMGWASQNVNEALTITFSAQYDSEASNARLILTSPPNNWIITDGGQI